MIVLGTYEDYTLVVSRSNVEPTLVTYQLYQDGKNVGGSLEDHPFLEAERRYEALGRPEVDFWDADKLVKLGVMHPPENPPEKKAGRYILIGGKPFTGHTGTTSYTGLQVVATSDKLKGLQELYQYNWDICGGLLLIIDSTTGKGVE
ncbi:hypothetical protein LCGC14_0941740 [marine sediment metagenome]|uniref:Uncharacterized protein n=1 Tax=marine sediment metagenome TaxID=412755 RepID=A0A0F9RR99_9ZZZZ